MTHLNLIKLRVIKLGSNELQRSRRLRFEPIRAFHFCLCSKSNHFTNQTLNEWNNEASAFIVLIIQWRPIIHTINSCWKEKIAHESTTSNVCPHREWRSCFVAVVRVMNFRGVHRMQEILMNMWLQAVWKAARNILKLFHFEMWKYSTTFCSFAVHQNNYK